MLDAHAHQFSTSLLLAHFFLLLKCFECLSHSTAIKKQIHLRENREGQLQFVEFFLYLLLTVHWVLHAITYCECYKCSSTMRLLGLDSARTAHNAIINIEFYDARKNSDTTQRDTRNVSKIWIKTLCVAVRVC